MHASYERLMVLLASPGDGWGHPWGDGGGWTALWWPFMMLFWVAVLAVGVWLLVRRTGPAASRGADRAQDVLAERFARGQVSEEEYEERLSVLRRRES